MKNEEGKRRRSARLPKSLKDSEPSLLKKAGVVVVAPEEKKVDRNARLIDYRLDDLSRVNYFKLAPPKSKGQ